MSKSRVLLLLLLSFILGVFVRSFFEIGQNVYFLAIVISVLLLIVFYKNPRAIIVAFIACFFLLGVWKTDVILQKANSAIFAGKNLQEFAMVEKVTQSSFGQNLILSVNQEKEKILILAQTNQYPIYKYGDELNITCTLRAIENKDANFDYRMYMAKDGILYKCDKAKMKIVEENNGNALLTVVLKIRSAFEDKLESFIAQPEGALANGILFGGGNELSKEIQNDFSKTGMTHIVAVSGYNVTIIAEYLIILGIFFGLWRKNAIWFAIVGIILFVIMSGLPASAVRAGFMASILLWAMKNGRLASAENAIIFAAAIMLFQNPLLLRYDVGFQLSFLATLGIVMTSPFWEKSFIKKHKALGISETIAMSLSAQIFVLPIIAYNFHVTSLISLLANILILPIIPLSMLLVFITAIASFIFTPLALIFAWFSYLPLHYEIKLIHLLAGFPWASVNFNNVGLWFIVGYYTILFSLMIKLKSHRLSP